MVKPSALSKLKALPAIVKRTIAFKRAPRRVPATTGSVPPVAPRRVLSSTWRCIASRTAGADLVVVGAALLAAQVRRKRGLIHRERHALRTRTHSDPDRVSALEKELYGFARSVERCKLAAIRHSSIFRTLHNTQ